MSIQKSNSQSVVAFASVKDMSLKIRQKSQLKGRQADQTSLQEVRALLLLDSETLRQRRDLLIEHLHTINDTYRGLHERHLVALAKLMNMAMAEVYEVATFYHHFEIIPEGEQAPQFTVRVCDGLSCDMSGAATLLTKLQSSLGTSKVKVVSAPCVGRCEQAPVAVVHQHEIGYASVEKVLASVQAEAIHPVVSDYIDLNAYMADGGYALLQGLASGTHQTEAVLKAMEDSGLRGLGGAGCVRR